MEARGFAMPYCPQCSIEYIDGTTQCEDCGTALLPGSPPGASPQLDLAAEKDAKLVQARAFAGSTARIDADLARNLLQTQGIPSSLSGEGDADPLPVGEVHLLVREEDASRAERVLQEFLDTEVPPAAEDEDATEK